jgi:SAM-dependent methyltransferase
MSSTEKISQGQKVSMHDDWFDIADQNHFWMKWRWRSIAKFKKYLPQEGQTFLEIGSGNGISVDQFENFTSCIVDGCDLNEKALLLSKPSKGRKLLYNIYDKKSELLNHYDGIILLDVLEHIDDDLQFLQTALLHSKNGGHLIINVPAHQWLYSDYDKAVGHIRRYSQDSLYSLLKQANLSEIKVSSWGTSLIPIAMLRKKMIAGKGEDIIKAGFKPSSKFIDFFLTTLMKLETSLPIQSPFGTSLIAVAKIIK